MTTTDPLFERRELVRTVSVPAKYLQKNIRGSLLGQLSTQVEGKCGVEGYIQPKSSVILEHSLGKVDMLHSGVRYQVRFHADVCFPHKGQVFRAPVTFRSKIGIHAEVSPIRVLLPRDLHIGNAEFDTVTEKDEIVFEVLGAEFKQNDDAIFVLGKFLQIYKESGNVVKLDEEEAPAPIPAQPPQEGGGEEKRVMFKPVEKPAEPAAAPARRRKQLGSANTNTLKLNVDGSSSSAAEGEA